MHSSPSIPIVWRRESSAWGMYFRSSTRFSRTSSRKKRSVYSRPFKNSNSPWKSFSFSSNRSKKWARSVACLNSFPEPKNLRRRFTQERPKQQMKREKPIINPMPLEERRNPAILNGRRRLRIAQGSGTTVTDINRLMKQFMEMKKMMQRGSKLGVRSLLIQMQNPLHYKDEM